MYLLIVIIFQDGDMNDYNEQNLKYASSIIIDRDECIKIFKNHYIKHRIRHNLMCADGKGNFNSRGKYLFYQAPTMKICNRRSGGNYTVTVC